MTAANSDYLPLVTNSHNQNSSTSVRKTSNVLAEGNLGLFSFRVLVNVSYRQCPLAIPKLGFCFGCLCDLLDEGLPEVVVIASEIDLLSDFSCLHSTVLSETLSCFKSSEH